MIESTMARRTARVLSVLGAMYVAQGIVWGFASFVLLPTLASRGVSLEAQTGILALAGVPWVLKLLWGPVLDRFGGPGRGRARWFCSLAMVAIAVSLFSLAGVHDPAADVSRIAVSWLLLNVALSLQDVATDAMALDALAESERGLGNGVMLGGHHVGMEGIGGLALGAVVAGQGLSAALWVQGAILLGLSLAPFAMPVSSSSRARALRPRLRDVLAAITVEGRLAVAALAAVVLFADVLTSSLSAELLVNRLRFDPQWIASRLPPVLLGASLSGYACAAALSDRIGHGRTAALGSAALGSIWIAFALAEPLWTHEAFFLGSLCLQALATALLYVGVHAVLMDATIPAIRATHFAVLTMLLNLPRVVAPTLAPAALHLAGWAGLFIAAGIVQAAMAWPLSRLRPLWATER
jgi:PAT family beta-lactamase induction signal transducer AmpG